MRRPNLLFILADQLRASSLPLYGESQIETPHIDRLAREGIHLTNAIASCPVCTPFRGMLLTGRHPQTTGHVVNFMRTRHDEIGIGDVFGHAGYRTGWVGKWHLHTGSFPEIDGADFVPEGRDRLGFQYWRGYNFHHTYFNGWVNRDDWRCERWEGYETEALARYAIECMEAEDGSPFCVFVSPHPPHATGHKHAPDEYDARLPQNLTLPENVPDGLRDRSLEAYRRYLAMTLAVDDMTGELLAYLDRAGRAEDTIVVFASDHGTQMGAHGFGPWEKKLPYEESIRVPLLARWPGVFKRGRECDALTAPVDFLPTLCGLCDIPIPRTVEGVDLSEAWRGSEGAFEREDVFTMNFLDTYDYLVDGNEWRGIRTKRYNYARWLDGRVELYDIEADPLQTRNLASEPDRASVRDALEARLHERMAERHDEMMPGSSYGAWFDAQRRVIRNAFGPLGDPEQPPDWSLLS